jgi:hypothetical protein
MPGRDGLAEQLRELSQLDDRGGGIIGEVTLRKCPELFEAGVVRSEKAEIARSQ